MLIAHNALAVILSNFSNGLLHHFEHALLFLERCGDLFEDGSFQLTASLYELGFQIKVLSTKSTAPSFVGLFLLKQLVLEIGHLLTERLDLLHDGDDGLRVLAKQRSSLLRQFEYLFCSIFLRNGKFVCFEARQYGVDHAGAWGIKTARVGFYSTDDIVSVSWSFR